MKELGKRILAGIGITVFVLIGLAQCVGESIRITPVETAPAVETSSWSSEQAREAFLSTVLSWSADQPRVTLMDVATDAELVNIAIDVCLAFDDGMTGREVADFIIGEIDQEFWEDAAVLTGAAVGAYCPEYDF